MIRRALVGRLTAACLPWGGAFLLAVAVLVVSARADALDVGSLPRPELLTQALGAYQRVAAAGFVRTRLLTVIDYALPSSERRLWVIDPERLRVLFHEFVAHGRGSSTDADPDRAVRFGNDPSSLRSSLGTFVTGRTYAGKHGHSLELIGLDAGVNDNALARRIVMHPAVYVSASYRAFQGRVGRSWGCPALDPAVAAALIDRIRDGSVLYAAGVSGSGDEHRTASRRDGGQRLSSARASAASWP